MLKTALLSGLASALNADFATEDLTLQEQSRAADLMRTRYACPEWNVPSK